MSEHEERLRAALRHGAGSPGDPQDPYDSGLLDTAGMLDRVRRGARRRRARRTVGGVVAVGAVVAALSLAVPAVLDDGGPTPAADDAPTGGGALVQTVSAAGDSVWVTVRVDCETGTCPALARSSDNGDTWAVAALRPNGNAGQTFTAQHVELAGTAVDGWAWNQTKLIASHDAGESWRRVELPGGNLVSGVAAGTDRAVAFTLGGLATKQVLSVSAVSDDRWAPIPAAVRPNEMVTRVFAGGDMLGAVLGSRVTARPHTLLLAPPGAGWERHALPCRAQGEVFADTDGDTLWTACLDGGKTLLADSTDGSDWNTVQLPAIIRNRHRWPRGTTAASCSPGSTAPSWSTPPASSTRSTHSAGDRQAANVAYDGYGSAASGEADWLASRDGQLLGSTDDGASWARVPVE